MKINRTWYPLQLFVRKWEVVVPLMVTFVAMIALASWLLYALERVPQPAFLHYSVESGVDAVGDYYSALALPGAVLLFAIINGVIANLLMLSARGAALLLIWSTIPLSICAYWFAWLLLRMNGAI